MAYILGVDIGTQTAKGVLLTEDLKVMAREYIEHGISIPQPGWAEHDAEEIWWNGFKRVLRGLVERVRCSPRKIISIGISALGSSLLPLSVEGIPLRPALLYCDLRSQDEVEKILQRLGEEFIMQMGGNVLSAESIGPKLLWFKKNEPERFARTGRILTATSYIICKLTSETVLDYSQATFFTPFYDYNNMTWNEEVCDSLGIPCKLLPELKHPTDIAGTITAEAARDTGLKEGTPVITSTADGFAESISMGSLAEGVTTLLYGTTTCIQVVTRGVSPISELRLAPHPLLPQQDLVHGATATSGALARWFRDNFGHVEREVQEKLGINAYELLDREAARVPAGSNGLVVLPYFSGERTPINDSLARGVIIGLTTYHSRGHLYRALLEGTAYAVKHHFGILKNHGVKPAEIIASGGGTKSPLWVQITSDVIGQDQILPRVATGAEIGAAYLAALAIGVIDNPSTLREKIMKGARLITTNKANYELYQEYYTIYRGIYNKIKEDMHSLARLSTITM